MGHATLAPPRAGRRSSLLDVAAAAFLLAVLLLLVLILTPLGDPLAASGRRALTLSASADSDPQLPVPSCGAEEVDLMPCEDPRRFAGLSREMNFYRERHCPAPGEAPLCLVPPPRGYRIPVPWPESLHKIWHDNMPYDKIAARKGHQGWMRQEGPYFIFPGGGTMFPDGAEQYIQKLGNYIPLIGGVLRTALDMGCGVASFGGFLLKENVVTLSFAPRDSHKSQIQFALERGIPAFVAMLGTRRLPFPGASFDFVHCSRCLIPFTAYSGAYFIEVDRVLRPAGYIVISGPPVQWANQDKEWADLQAMAQILCYELITVDGNTAIWKKPSASSCRPSTNAYGIGNCKTSVDPDEAWYFNLTKCIAPVSFVKEIAVGSIPKWPQRLFKPSARVSLVKNGPSLFEADARRWARRVAYYKQSLGVKLGTPHVRNVMDMNAFFGGFAVALIADPVWVMNVVPARKPSTLEVIYDRGLIGVYHDWCEAFSTYPRTYDFVHATGINSLTTGVISATKRCDLVDVMVEIDRLLRPEGTALIRDSPDVIDKAAQIAGVIRWTIEVHDTEPESRSGEKILLARKIFWTLPSTT